MSGNGKCNCTQQSHCRSEAARMQTCPCRKCKEKRQMNDQLRGVILDQHRQGANKFSTGGPGGGGFGGVGAQSFTGFRNENANFCVTFLLEIVGILVFFAIATLMFWVGVCYYSYKLAIKIKNADRNTQYAAACVGALILLVLMVTLVKNRTCATGHGNSCAAHSPPKSKCPSPCEAAKAKKEKAKAKAKAKVKAQPGSGCHSNPDSKRAAKANPQCGKCQPKPPPCAKAVSNKPSCGKPRSCKPKRTYSDCEGRRIYENSKRYAIPTEMKQPPSLLVYIQNWISERFRG